MAKAKPAKTVKKTTAKRLEKKAVAAKPSKPSLHENMAVAGRSMRISFLLFAFVVILTVGVLMYQYNVAPSGKEMLTSTMDATPSVDFSDMSVEDKSNGDFMAALKFLVGKKVISGYSDNTLKPGNSVNRAEFIKMLTVALKADVSGSAKACFKDVVGTEWFAQYICYAKDAGWVGGFPDGTILPGKQISLAEALKIIVTAEEWDITNTKDMTLPKSKKIDAGAWYIPYLKVAFSKSLLYYYKDANVDPSALLTRKDVIMVLFNAMLADTLKVEKYNPSLIPQLYQQEGVVMSGEAPKPVTPEATPKKK